MIEAREASTSVCRAAIVACVVLAGARELRAQMPGLPVLQNGFSNSGITVAGNYGRSSDLVGYGAAVAWAPASGRFQLSAGGGAVTPDGGARATSYGVRAAMPLGSLLGGGRIGLAPFAGVGGATFEGRRIMQIPVGIGAGFRARLGATRSVAVFATPFYSWTRASGSNIESTRAGLLRVSLGVDVALLPKVGATIGWESGQSAKDGDPGASSSTLGVGLSYVLH